MTREKFDNILTLEEALKRIKENDTMGYEWYPVKTKCGNILEVGGNDKGFKVDVIQLSEDGEIEVESNGFVKDVFSISYESDDHVVLETCVSRSELEKFASREELIDYLNLEKRLNYKELKIETVYKTVFDHNKITLE